MKYPGLILCVFGIAMIAAAMRMEDKASFEDGSFLWAVLLGCAGAFTLLIGAVMFLTAVFMAI